MFANRNKAGEQLAAKLMHYLAEHSELGSPNNFLVVGLPRGGVPVALAAARQLGTPLDILVSKKLTLPDEPEFAIGAVSSAGIMVLNRDFPLSNEWESYIEEQRKILAQKTRQMEEEFYALADRSPPSLKDKTVVVVDDGIATGMTAYAALETARHRGAKFIIMAAPVMAYQSYRELPSYCDAVITLSIPEDVLSVGQHYADFRQTTNEEVVEGMRESIKQATSSKT
jgi:putative phosphoribosyl transferase